MIHVEKKKRILIYSPIFYPDIGGPAIQAKFLAELLSEKGFEVFVIKYGKNEFDYPGVEVRSLNWASSPNLISRLYRWFFGPVISLYLVFRIRPNLVLVNSVFWNGMIMGMICRLIRVPTILKFTGDWVFESTKIQKDKSVDLEKIYSASLVFRILFFIERYLVSQFKVVWVISEFRKANVLRITDKPKIWLQKNFHDLPIFESNRQNRFRTPLVFVTVSRLVPHKRIDVLIEVLSKFSNDYIFIVIGDGEEFNKLKELVIKLNLSNKIFLLGQVSASLKYEVLSFSSVYLSWSAEEGAPNSFIEALNFGLPIVSANVGGIPEMFSHASKSAILVDPNSPDHLHMTINNLFLNPGNLEMMSADAVADSAKFSKKSNQNFFVQLISELIADSRL